MHKLRCNRDQLWQVGPSPRSRLQAYAGHRALPRFNREACAGFGPDQNPYLNNCGLPGTSRVHGPPSTPLHPVAPHNTDHPPLEPPKRRPRSRHVGDARCLPPGPRPGAAPTSPSTLQQKPNETKDHTQTYTQTLLVVVHRLPQRPRSRLQDRSRRAPAVPRPQPPRQQAQRPSSFVRRRRARRDGHDELRRIR